jgi:carbonic anhydrase/acetyltransferase-like protein (isoleucine patch superfamily)
MIEQFLSKTPKIPTSVFVAPSAKIVGDVEMGEDCSIWFNAVLRGDVNFIRVGRRTNIQDGAIVHVTFKKNPTVIGHDVTVGHGAILHGCTVKDHVLIGMGAKVLDGSVIGRYSLIAAGAVVKEGSEVPEKTLMAGVPAKPVRNLTEDEVIAIEQSAQRYIQYAETYRKLRIIDQMENEDL